MLQLRGHHLLCIQNFHGYGYDSNFIENMRIIVRDLAMNKNQSVQLIAACDAICQKCPWCQNWRCWTHGSDFEERVREKDERTLALLEMKEGIIVAFNEVQSRIEALLPILDLASLCKACQWLPICQKERIDGSFASGLAI